MKRKLVITSAELDAEERRVAIASVPELDACPPLHTKWSPGEEVILEKYYHTAGAKAVAKTLGRSIASVLNKARVMGLQGRTDTCRCSVGKSLPVCAR